MKYRFLVALLFAVTMGSAYATPERVDLSAGIYLIKAEVMATQSGRMRGLMFRKSLGANKGMLFIFPTTERHCMWMKNTLLPLSVAFIDERGAIVNIEDMDPQTEVSHCADRPVPYALEMNKGWFASRGIKSGAVLSGFDKLPAPDKISMPE